MADGIIGTPENVRNIPPSVERRGNVAHIVKPEGEYSIIYGRHDKTNSAEDLPQGVSALVLETGQIKWAHSPVDEALSLAGHVQFYKIAHEADKRDIPFVLNDFMINYTNTTLLGAAVDLSVMMVEPSLGGYLSYRGLSKGDEKLTRRNFLKRGVQLGLGAYFLANPTVLNILSSMSDKQDSDKMAKIKKVLYEIHPEAELMFLKIRNTVIAHKEQQLAVKMGGKPHLATAIGAGHVALESEIQRTPEQRMNFLKKVQPLLKILGDGNKEFYTSAVIKDKGQRNSSWVLDDLIEHQDLKALVT